MKIPYTFTVLRYVHDVLSGEFINVGIVLYAPKAKFLNATFTTRYGRLSKMFSDVKGEHFRQVVRYIQANIEEQGERLEKELQFKPTNSVLDLTARVLPVDDSSLQFSPEGYGLTDNPEKTLEQLYGRYVERYYEKSEKPSRSDEDVWKVFKKPFEEKRLLGQLTPHQIVGNNYEHEFKYCWKNEIWHANEAVSFDLADSGYLVDKANAWLGKAISLNDGGEPFKLYMLLGTPKEEKHKSAFIKAKNIMHQMPCMHEFIEEDGAENFAEHLKSEIEKHATGTIH